MERFYKHDFKITVDPKAERYTQWAEYFFGFGGPRPLGVHGELVFYLLNIFQ